MHDMAVFAVSGERRLPYRPA